MAVAKWTLPRPPRPPSGDHRRLAQRDEVRDQLTAGDVDHAGPGRHGEIEVLAGLAVALGPLPPAAGRRREVVLEAEVVEGCLARVHAQVHRAAASAVAAVGPTARDVGLPSEGGRPVAAGSGTHDDANVIKEHRGHCRTGPRPDPMGQPVADGRAAGYGG